MSVRLDALLRGLGARILGDAATDVSGVAYDSRRVRPGHLFVALRGAETDGHRFGLEATRAGAAALLVEEVPEALRDAPMGERPAIAQVADTRAVLGEVAARAFGEPGRAMTLIGVTGTNGKTSTVRLLESILTHAGRRVGSLGTISVRFAGHEEPAALTTPEAVDLQEQLARMRDAGIDTCALEVSSHSLAQDRVRPLRFEVAVFTHLSQDHLDYHGDMERYSDAKARLFGPEHLDGTAVLNATDPQSPRLAALARDAGRPVLTYGRLGGGATRADLLATRETVSLSGARVHVRDAAGERELAIPLPGDFQIDNALAAATAARALGVAWSHVTAGIAACPPVPGRLERVPDEALTVLVDYAHTPDALDRVLARVRPFVQGRLVVVFGCGGDRDRTKRAPMARAACRHADLTIATSDNPRTEDPQAILDDVAEGLSGAHEIVVDRRNAIQRAISAAQPGDAVLIAGKGHEDYQIIGREKRPFDDRVEARRALAARKRTS